MSDANGERVMRREVPIEDLQRKYTANDMVKADCRGCQGCSDCCSGMGESVVLDPLDCFQLEKGLGTDLKGLLEDAVELNVYDDLILPSLKMKGEEERCFYLNEEGRCSVHAFRPGICRLFPLGRLYEEGNFSYILQSHECPMENKSKVKISKWLGIPELKKYEDYVCRWHYLLEEIRDLIDRKKDPQLRKDMASYILEQFYVDRIPDGSSFYQVFDEKYDKMKKLLQILGR